MDHPDLTVLSFIEKSIGLQRVKYWILKWNCPGDDLDHINSSYQSISVIHGRISTN